MEVRATDTFAKSLIKLINTTRPWKWDFWEHKWIELKRSLWALWKYFWITTKMVPWDYSSVLRMLKFQIEILADYIEKRGYEVDESRLPKVAKMRRFIELINHKIEDDYADRCGYDYNYGFDFEPIEGSPHLSKMVSNAPPEIEENNNIAIKEAYELEEREWNEMFEILKDLRGWWD
jgi:hypothetical protein